MKCLSNGALLRLASYHFALGYVVVAVLGFLKNIYIFFNFTPFSPQFHGIQLATIIAPTPVWVRERRRLNVMRPPIHNPTSRTAS